VTIKSAHSRVFEQLLSEWRQRLLEALATNAVQDYAGYRHRVGQLEGLNDALRLSEEADFKLNGDDIVDR
jgi:predicted thioredoxin/glutaredoxin